MKVNDDMRIVQVAMGPNHVLALRANGTVIAWGANDNGQCDVPADLRDVVQVSAGYRHSLAVTNEGRLVAWGVNDHGQCDVPAELTGVVLVAAGTGHSLALTRDGCVVAWGNNSHRQCDVPAGLTSVVQVAVGTGHSLAVTRDGQLVTWGMNNTRQCDVPAGLTGVVQVAVGTSHSLAVTRDAQLVAWGMNNTRQCDVPAGLTGVVQVAAGTGHSLAVTRDGRVVAWGANNNGQCDVPAGLTGVVLIAAGTDNSLAVTRDGRVVAWGSWRHMPPSPLANVTKIFARGDVALGLHHGGQIVEIGSCFQPTRNNPIINDAVQVAAIDSHLLVLRRDGTVMVLNRDGKDMRNVPSGLQDVVQVATRRSILSNDFIAVTRQGQVVVWDEGGIVHTKLSDVVQVSSSKYSFFEHLLALKRDGTVMELGRELSEESEPPVQLDDVVQVSAGDEFSLALTRDGRVVAWGSNDEGQCQVPAIIASGMVDVVQIATGRAHSLACTRDGRAIAWGNNNYGQCEVPVELADVTHVIAQDDYSIALTHDGRVYSWGSKNLRSYRRLHELDVVHIAFTWDDELYVLTRDGRVERLSDETCMPHTFSDVTDVALGEYHGLALTSQGHVLAWGHSDKGQCHVPLSLTDYARVHLFGYPLDGNYVVQIAVGTNHSVVLTRGGRVVVWGDNDYGQCNVPSDLQDVVQVAACNNHSLALTRGGRVFAWGDNDYGQCHVPSGLKDVVHLATSSFHSLALTRNGQVVAWGDDDISALCHVPTGLCDVIKIVAGRYHSLALTRNGQVIAWGENTRRQCDVPTGLCDVVHLVIGDDYSLALTAQGYVLAWGGNEFGQCDVPVWLRDVVQIAACNTTAYAVLRTGQVISWGGNSIADTDRLIQIGTNPHLQYIHPFAAYAGGEAQLFSTPAGLLKKYHTPEKTPAIAKLRHLIANPVTLTHHDRSLIIWPQELAYDPFTGQLAGYVMPFVSAKQLLELLDTTSRRQRWPELATDAQHEWRFVLTVARWCAAVLDHIHTHDYVVGNVSVRDILVYPEGTVAFVDCDSYQVGDGSEYGCGVSTVGYRAPEVRVISEGHLAYSVHTDAFALATIVFRLICGNYHPYQGITLPSPRLNPALYETIRQRYPQVTQLIPSNEDATTYCTTHRIWPYDPNQQVSVPPQGMQEYYAQLPADVRALFHRAFTGEPVHRPTPAEWVQVLDAWLAQV